MANTKHIFINSRHIHCKCRTKNYSSPTAINLAACDDLITDQKKQNKIHPLPKKILQTSKFNKKSP